MDHDDYSFPGLEATITLTPRETTALASIGAGRALWALANLYKPDHWGGRGRDQLDSLQGWRQEFEDALATLERLADRMQGEALPANRPLGRARLEWVP